MAAKKSDIKKFFLETKISQVMASPVITVKETDNFALVQEKIALYDVRHLPVVNDAGCLVGLISQRDLYQIHSPRRLEDGSWYYDKEALGRFLLSKVMASNPFTLKPDDTLYSAIEAMVRFKFGCIPIVDDYQIPCGILTRHTILKFCVS
ncbi:MAG: CBS domain-containing protein [Candidatus Omnitrophica bacterium]|nr:CBS domain-containing protein [Candidatus Omnitrophota bacterium]MDE2231464.1 CBS domain-containing protein [Candidatus Omnitrophota bacterium]